MIKFSLAVFASLAFAAPAAAKMPADDALLGTWNIIDGAAAPWAQAKDRSNLAAIGKRLIKTPVKFGPGDVATPAKSLACKMAVYEATEYSPDAMFRGALPEPNQDRAVRALGFPRGDIPGVDVTCESETFSYHFRDKATIMIAVDDILYTLKRGK